MPDNFEEPTEVMGSDEALSGDQALTAEKALDEWLQTYVHNSKYSQDTALYNQIHQSVQHIKTVLNSVIK